MSIQESTDADSPYRRAAATPPAALHGPPWGAVAGSGCRGRVLGSPRRMVAAAVDLGREVVENPGNSGSHMRLVAGGIALGL